MKYIENLLYEKTKDTKSEILFTQWSYDKKIIPQALNSISNLFPHYSLHDESHSITIINNIIRVLGRDAIEKLSAIDLWLILASSYYHDIGMIVSAQKLIDAIESKEFLSFFINLLEDQQHGLYEFAKDFKVENDKIVYTNTVLSLKKHDGIKFILAEYFRKDHSNRSETIIINPNEEFNLSSPRNAMPERIFKTLGKICSSHTKNFADVMHLSFCEVGIDTEDMHPRFIACLLRIGDLLDLDNDRFSDVMLSTLSKIPVDTHTHQLKHMSIESFRADKKEISILAKCEDYDIAEITQHWFDYINHEITNQMLNWNKIVPSKGIGYLPSIGSLQVELTPYEYIDGKNKPKFSVDTSKALDLLRGAGIYEKPIQSFREILQNAVDSTLIRIWEENKVNRDIFIEPFTDEFKNLTGKYPIKVLIKSKGVEENFKLWEITIEDNAMGLSSHDLKFLMHAGSSSKNEKKKNIVREMPKWLQPSGVFGIGFQSIFQITDEVKITTKDFFEEQYQEITLYSPESSKNGAILVEKKISSHAIKPGSKVIFDFKTILVPQSYSLGRDKSYTKSIIDSYDYFSSDSLDVEIAYVVDEVLKFSSNSYFPVELSIDGDDLTSSQEKEKPFIYYDPETLLELNIFPNKNTIQYKILVYYKNQLVEQDKLPPIKFLGVALNIHTDSATKVLTLNRNEIRKEYSETLLINLYKTLYRTITNKYNIFSDEEKIYLSMFLNYYSSDNNLKEFDVSKYDEYKNLTFKIKEKEFKLDILLQKKEIIINFVNDHRQQDTYALDKNTLTITVYSHPQGENTQFLLFKARDNFTSIKVSGKTDYKTIHLSKVKQKNPYTDEDYFEIIKSLQETSHSRRIFLPCMIEQFKDLRIKNSAYIPWIYYHSSLSNILEMPKMLSPFIIKNQNLDILLNDKVYTWVFDNRYNEDTTKDDIVTSYKNFIETYYNN